MKAVLLTLVLISALGLAAWAKGHDDCDPEQMDVNHDGCVTAVDALTVLRVAVGLECRP